MNHGLPYDFEGSIVASLSHFYFAYLVCAGWNMMFFLWGVFKGNKENCLHALGAEKLLTQDISRIILPLPDNLCDLGHIKNAAYGSTAENTEMPASKESESVSSYNMLTEKCGSQGSSQVSKDLCI